MCLFTKRRRNIWKKQELISVHQLNRVRTYLMSFFKREKNHWKDKNSVNNINGRDRERKRGGALAVSCLLFTSSLLLLLSRMFCILKCLHIRFILHSTFLYGSKVFFIHSCVSDVVISSRLLTIFASKQGPKRLDLWINAAKIILWKQSMHSIWSAVDIRAECWQAMYRIAFQRIQNNTTIPKSTIEFENKVRKRKRWSTLPFV